MEVGDVERFLKSRDVEYTIVAVERGEEEEVNAESTAVLLGVNSSVVVKSLVFVVGNHPVLVVLSGDKKVSIKKLSQCLKQQRDRLRERGESVAIADRAASVKLAPWEDAEEWTGYRIGMIPPFAHRRSMLTIVDEEVLLTPRVFVGCGRMELELSIKVEDLLAVTGAVVADVGRESEEGRREGPLLPYSRFHTSVRGGNTKARQALEGGEQEEERERDEEEGEETGSDEVYEITSEWKDVDAETLPSTFLTGDFCLISANKIGRRLLFGFAVHRDMRREVAQLVSSRSLHRSIRRRRSWCWRQEEEETATFSLQLIFGKTLTTNIGDEEVERRSKRGERGRKRSRSRSRSRRRRRRRRGMSRKGKLTVRVGGKTFQGNQNRLHGESKGGCDVLLKNS